MAKEIKTKSSLKDVKSIDKTAALKDKVKIASIKAKNEIKDSARQSEGRGDETPSGYASENTGRGAEYGANVVQSGAARLIRRKRDGAENTGSGKSPKTKEQIRRAENRRDEARAGRASVVRTDSARKNSGAFRADEGGKATPKTKTYSVKTEDRYTRKFVKSARKAPSQAARARLAKQETIRSAAKIASAKKAKRTARTTRAVVQRATQAIIAAFRALIMAIASVGSVAILIVIIVILVAAILASALGIFFSNDAGGTTCRDAVAQLTGEFADEMRRIESENPHDELVVTYTGGASVIDWRSALAVYAAKVTEDADGALDVISFDDTKLSKLRETLFDMNKIIYETMTEERRATSIGEDGEEVSTTFTVTILKIIVTQMTITEAMAHYGFTASQKESLAEITKPDYDAMWAELLGGFTSEGGMGEPSPERVPTGMFTWPLPVSATITSYYGWREDPFTGEMKYHDGTDLSCVTGTPILAAATGTVIIANGTDAWGGGYGYYVRIAHGGGMETVYAHCSSIAVRQGDAVAQGQIVGYVGNTGRSTGSHLHWEVYQNGIGQDGLTYFA